MNYEQKQKSKECLRCGTCCKKGGPALHLEDMPIIEEGGILLKDLFTIRKGETAHDNVNGGLRPVETDIIKIKSVNGGGTCIFFNDEKKRCEIYLKRPLECRVLKCWDTMDIERAYSKNRLTRRDILEKISGLWEIIRDHEEKCGFKTINIIIGDMAQNEKSEQVDKLNEMAAYDNHIRALIVEKGGVDPLMADFLLGRPLGALINKLLRFHDLWRPPSP